MHLINADRRGLEIRMRIDDLDDLWHLANLIDAGDHVRSMTERREEKKSDRPDEKRGEKRRMLLTIKVEGVEFQEFADRLRVLGTITEGPQDLGKHHSINLEPGDDLTVIKEEWKRHHIERLKRARVRRGTGPVFVALDSDEATIVDTREYGMREVANIVSGGRGKRESGDERAVRGQFHDEVLRALAGGGYDKRTLVVLGPGFEREHFASFLHDKGLKPHVLSSAHTGMAGVHEVMKRGLGGGVVRELRVTEETRLVERLMEEISKNGKITYGREQVRGALDRGAGKELIIVETMVRRPEAEAMLAAAERTGCEVHVISMFHEAGRRLHRMGGVALFTRF
ncbi:MAG: mRNA surveillance protein pelota [Gammaproteobacteria bacterium]